MMAYDIPQYKGSQQNLENLEILILSVQVQK